MRMILSFPARGYDANLEWILSKCNRVVNLNVADTRSATVSISRFSTSYAIIFN